MSLASTRQSVSLDPPGTSLSRLIHALSLNNAERVQELTERGPWRSTPQVHAALVDLAATKAATAIGTTTDAAWAGPLVEYGFAREALTLLKEVSLFEQLKPRLREVPFRTKVAREIGAGTGAAWVGEGAAAPAIATAYDTLTVEQFKIASIVTLTRELLILGDPVAEKSVRAAVLAGAAKFADEQLLDPTITHIPGVRPASITNGAPSITSTGTTGAAILTDLAAMVAAIATAGSGLVWVMRPKTAAHIAGALGSSAGSDLPTRLFALPVVLNANAPPPVTLIDGPEILYADSGGFAMDGSRVAALQSDSAPTSPLTPPLISLFQQDLFALRVVRWLAWLRARDGAVVYMAVSY